MVGVKRARRKNVFRGIRANLNRFLSILFIVALGAGFLAGLFATSPDMYETADRYMDEYALYDIAVQSPLCFTREQADALAETEGIETLQAACVRDVVLTGGAQESYTARIFALLDENGRTTLNCLKLLSGRLPQTAGECVLQNTTGEYVVKTPKLGTRLNLSAENPDLPQLKAAVASDTLTVVGVVESPMCLGMDAETTKVGSGSIAMDIYVPQEYFTLPVYTTLYISVMGAREMGSFDDDYKNLIQTVVARLERQNQAQWRITTREDAAGFASYRSNVGKVSALSKIFPVFFFLVALLVALTTMTRLVEENRTQIGTLKALGFSDGQVLAEYLLFSLLASVLGCVLGFSVGFWLFPTAISGAYGMMYFLPQTSTPLRWDIIAFVAPATILSILLATLWACYGEFRACPAALMLPKAPKAGKRIWLEHITPVWKRLPFTYKVTCRNLFRYKKRFIMTIIGVAGCSALLVTGFGLRDSINDIVDKQFGELYRYELTVVVADENASDLDPGLNGFLNNTETITAWTQCATQEGKIKYWGETQEITLSVPQDTAHFSEFITLRERETQAALTLKDGGVILTEKLCEMLNVSVGDTVTLENDAGERGSFRVGGIAENYITAYAYMTPSAYLNAFGSVPQYTQLLCCLAPQADAAQAVTEVLSCDGVLFARSSQNLRDTFSDNIKSIDAIVLILIASAGLLCFVVLYNLTNVNICERRKELATIRVLGFYERETERYIFRETNTLSFLGAFLGLFAGIRLHAFVIRTVEVDEVMFGRSIYPMSYVYAMLISVIFTLLVNQVMKHQIRNVDMVEAMKANE